MNAAWIRTTRAVLAAGAIVLAYLVVAASSNGAWASGVPSAAIDLDSVGNAPNGPLGMVQDCISAPVGSSVTFDVTIRDLPQDDAMIAFQYVLTYDPVVTRVVNLDNQQMLASAAGSQVYDISDPLPDFDGSVYVAAVELAAGDVHEYGDGVLSRVTVEVTGPGIGLLSLSDSAVVDGSNHTIPVNVSSDAIIAAGRACPGPGEATPSPRPTPEPPGGPAPTPSHPDPTPWHAPYVVKVESGSVLPGGTITLGVWIDAPYPGVGAMTIDVLYDLRNLTAVSCEATFPDGPGPYAVCNPAYRPDAVRFVGVSVDGASGAVPVGTVTFVAGYELGDYPVRLSVEDLVTPDSSRVGSMELSPGVISITTMTPTPAPTPRAPALPSPQPPIPPRPVLPTPSAAAPPQRPAGVGRHGTAVFDGVVCDSGRCGSDLKGMVIIATIGAIECGRSLVSDGNKYQIEVASNAEVRGCGLPGRMIEFMVGGRRARPAAMWKAGAQQLDLILMDAAGTASFLPGPKVRPSSHATKTTPGVAETRMNANSRSDDVGRLMLLVSPVPALIGAMTFYKGLKRR